MKELLGKKYSIINLQNMIFFCIFAPLNKVGKFCFIYMKIK